MPRVTCVKCGREGNLTTKKTRTSGKTYTYYYVQHYIKETDKIEWCYLGSFEKLLEEYKELVKSTVHKRYTQNKGNYTQNKKSPILGFISQKNLSDIPLATTNTFQNHALSEPNRLFQTTQQNHPTFRGFVKEVVAHFFGYLSCKVSNLPVVGHVFEVKA